MKERCTTQAFLVSMPVSCIKFELCISFEKIVSRPVDIKMCQILDLQQLVSFVWAWIRLEIERKVKAKHLSC